MRMLPQAREISRRELSAVPTPEPTDTWRPLPRIYVVNTLTERAAARGLKVRSERYSVTTGTCIHSLASMWRLAVPACSVRWISNQSPAWPSLLVVPHRRPSQQPRQVVRVVNSERRAGACLRKWSSLGGAHRFAKAHQQDRPSPVHRRGAGRFYGLDSQLTRDVPAPERLTLHAHEGAFVGCGHGGRRCVLEQRHRLGHRGV